MKLRNISFLLSFAVVLPQMSFAMERPLWIGERPSAEKKPEMTKAEKKLASIKEALEITVKEFKEFGTTPGGEEKLEELENNVRRLKRMEKSLEKLGEMEPELRQGMDQEYSFVSEGEGAREVAREVEIEVEKFMAELDTQRKLELNEPVVPKREDAFTEGETFTKEEADKEKPKKPFKLSEDQKAGIGLATLGVILAAGYLYKQAPQWMKNRVKGVLLEHDKKLSDATPAEQDLLMAASYARFNPAGYFFFKRAVANMPLDQEFSKELWPVLYHVYYGTKKPKRKQKKELKKMYDEAREDARVAAQKVAHNKRLWRVKRKVV